MKKSKTMRAAAILLVLVLITSCFVGSTFAKYISTAKASSQARVAYWGFNSTAETELGLFDFDDTGILDGSEYLIAPGSGNEITFKVIAAEDVTKAPEVDYVLRIGVSGSGPAYAFNGTSTPDDLAYPGGGVDGLIEWYVTDGDGKTTTYKTWKEFRTGIASLDGVGDHWTQGTTYQAGELPDILKGEEVKIGWKWAFDGISDKHDTAAGNKALTTYGQMKLAIEVTVEQLDGTPAPTF